jgi:hypothetical protein
MTPPDDQRAPVTGIAWGLMLSIPLWIVIALIAGVTHG